MPTLLALPSDLLHFSPLICNEESQKLELKKYQNNLILNLGFKEKSLFLILLRESSWSIGEKLGY